MLARKLGVLTRQFIHRSRLAQIGVILAFWLLGEATARVTHLPVPGGIIGMGILLALIASGRISLTSTRRGANWFLAEMLLFFVPACLAVLAHQELFGLIGLKILFIICAGTLCVMFTTALVVELSYRWITDRNHARAILDQ